MGQTYGSIKGRKPAKKKRKNSEKKKIQIQVQIWLSLLDDDQNRIRKGSSQARTRLDPPVVRGRRSLVLCCPPFLSCIPDQLCSPLPIFPFPLLFTDKLDTAQFHHVNAATKFCSQKQQYLAGKAPTRGTAREFPPDRSSPRPAWMVWWSFDLFVCLEASGLQSNFLSSPPLTTNGANLSLFPKLLASGILLPWSATRGLGYAIVPAMGNCSGQSENPSSSSRRSALVRPGSVSGDRLPDDVFCANPSSHRKVYAFLVFVWDIKFFEFRILSLHTFYFQSRFSLGCFGQNFCRG